MNICVLVNNDLTIIKLRFTVTMMLVVGFEFSILFVYML